MNKMIGTALALATLFMAASCSPSENTVDAGDVPWRLFYAQSNATLPVYQQPSGTVVSPDVIATANPGTTLPAAPSKIRKYRADLYLIFAEQKIVWVVDGNSYKVKDSIALATTNEEKGNITDFCVVNATTAFVSWEQSPVLTVLDITGLTTGGPVVQAFDVPMNHPGNHLLSVGTDIYVSQTANSRIEVLDVRRYETVEAIQLSFFPGSLALSLDEQQLVVVSSELNPLTAERQPMAIAVVSPQNRQLAATSVPQQTGTIAAARDVVVTDAQYAVIAATNGVWRFDLRDRNTSRRMFAGAPHYLDYSSSRREVMVVDTANRSIVLTSSAGVSRRSFRAPFSFRFATQL